MNLIIYIILLFLTLVALAISHNIFTRTCKDLKIGLRFILLSLIVLVIFWLFEILSEFTLIINKANIIILFIFLILLIIGLSKIKRCIKIINGEIVTNKKIKIKKKK